MFIVCLKSKGMSSFPWEITNYKYYTFKNSFGIFQTHSCQGNIMFVYKHKISNKITIFSMVFRKIHFCITKILKDISCYPSYFSRYIMLFSITCDWQLCTIIKSVSVAIFFIIIWQFSRKNSCSGYQLKLDFPLHFTSLLHFS